MKKRILDWRGTLFYGKQNKVDVNNYMTYIDAMKGLNVLPSVNKGVGFNVNPDGSVGQEEIVSLDFSGIDDPSFKISFRPGRIDITSSNPEMTPISFLEKIKKVGDALKDIYSEGYIRYALGATTMFDFNANIDCLNKVYDAFMKNDKNEIPIEWSTRKVLRSTLSDAEYSVDVNNVYTISRGIFPGKSSMDAVILEHDINTVVDADIHSLFHLQKLFFEKAAETITDSLEEYSEILSK